MFRVSVILSVQTEVYVCHGHGGSDSAEPDGSAQDVQLAILITICDLNGLPA